VDPNTKEKEKEGPKAKVKLYSLTQLLCCATVYDC